MAAHTTHSPVLSPTALGAGPVRTYRDGTGWTRIQVNDQGGTALEIVIEQPRRR